MTPDAYHAAMMGSLDAAFSAVGVLAVGVAVVCLGAGAAHEDDERVASSCFKVSWAAFGIALASLLLACLCVSPEEARKAAEKATPCKTEAEP